MAQLMSIKRNVEMCPGQVSVPAIYHVSQGDKGTRIILGLVNNSANYTIPDGTTATIRGHRADGTLFTEITADVETTEVKFNLTEDMSAIPGRAECEAVLASGSANVIGTANFIIDVEKSPASIGSIIPGTDAATTWLIDKLENEPINELNGESVVDAINSSGSGSGLTESIKTALLACFEKVAWIDEDGQDYYDALYDALYPPAPPATLTSITCVYTQSGVVYDTDTLDSLKSDLVVTAHYDNGTSQVVATYTLSGTLAEGTSTITVSYGGKTTTFTVIVSGAPSYVTNGLIHMWDGVNNTGNGDDSHSSITTTWKDLVGNIDLSGPFDNAAWAENGLTFNTPTVRTKKWYSDNLPSLDGACTIEMVVTINSAVTAGIASFGPSRSSAPNSSNPVRKICIYADGTLTGNGQSGLTYLNPETELTDVHYISCIYDATLAVTSIRVNEQEASVSDKTHSLAYGYNQTFIGLGDGSSNVYGFNGTIHAIRIYNRALTDAERTQNYNMDVSRFGV